ncbi:MAG: hypothetical protein ACRDPR_21695, partial [Nocardioidaceae bacterium]
MEPFERATLDAYFGRIVDQFKPAELPASFLVTHLLPERPSFVGAVAKQTSLRAVLPKPKSIHAPAQRAVEKFTQCDSLSRELFEDPEATLDYFEARAAGDDLVLLDVGGY